jgi:hypothetical protein
VSTPAVSPAQRRQLLLLRIAVQRQLLGAQVDDIEARLAGIDHRLVQVRDFLRSPMAWAGGIGLVLAMGPRRLLRFAGRGVLALGTLRRMFWRLKSRG